MLKTTLSVRGLNAAALEVERALRDGDVANARRLVSWHLVSRETGQLDDAQVAAATIELVAENTSDAIVGPLLYYLIAGVPGAMAYRYVNTADALLGYHDPTHEWLGKGAARLDDLLNLIPARLTGLTFVLLRPRAWRVWWRDAGKTASPNAGHPMSAMAGALDVVLVKAGHYTLNDGARPATADDIRRARHLMGWAVGLVIAMCVSVSPRR